MPCYHPMTVYRSRVGRDPHTGRWPITWNKRDGYTDAKHTLQIPCGKCIGCRLEYSRQWAIRCVHEAQLWPTSCFITLTYDNDHLPENESLCKRDVQLFFKRLRRELAKNEIKIRYFCCGEYGGNTKRPHYHAAIYNYDFPDKKFYRNVNGNKLYYSPQAKQLWPAGHNVIGELTWESAAYIARYIVKKITGESAETHYAGRTAEFATMSRRPGIGREWWRQFQRDVIRTDSVVLRDGIKMRPARYYDKIYDDENKHLSARRKYRRSRRAPENWETLLMKEKIKKLTIKQLKRQYEEE
jgi:hypothetical protein